MLYRIFFLLLIVFLFGNIYSTETDSVLFSFNDHKVSLSEFNKVYQKSNLGRDDAYSIESLNEYLSLYINFKLKVQEALDTRFDTVPSVRSEINKYRSQLTKSHMQSNNIYDELMLEAYERKKVIRDVSHVLIKLSPTASPEDASKAYAKAMEVYNKVKDGGKCFLCGKNKKNEKTRNIISKLAFELSEDPSAKKNKGYLGFVQVLNYVYHFENAVYSTPLNNVSLPFRTRFGYHIIMVHEEDKNPGSVQTAHLFLQTKAGSPNKKELIDKIYQSINSGDITFEDAVNKYSEDTQSKPNNGKLRWFSKGEMVAEYQDASFALKNKGEVSEPIQTRYGWHIIKLLDKKQLGGFEKEKSEIKQKLLKSARREVAQARLISQIKKENNYKYYEINYLELEKRILEAGIKDSLNLSGPWMSLDISIGNWDKALFNLNDRAFTQKDFLTFLRKQRRYKKATPVNELLKTFFAAFEEQSCLSYEESILEEKDPDFKALMKEYHDGILLFEIMDKKVWSKAVADSSGLSGFYNNNKTKYLWEERMHSKRYKCNKESLAQEIYDEIKNNPSIADSSVFKRFNDESQKHKVFIEEKRLEDRDDTFKNDTRWALGLHLIKKAEEKNYFVINNITIIPESPKALKDTKGQVIADYQDFLEKDWIRSLKDKYKVSVNANLLEQLTK